jgi:hypothetical protein
VGQETDDRSPSCDDRHAPEHPVYSLTDRTLASWGRTWRALVLIVAIVGLLVGGMWLLNIEATIGPVHIGR